MPLFFLLIGILFLVLARNGTQGEFEQLLKSEFTGSQSFVVWASALVLLGLVGFFKPVRPIADAMIGLIILVLILHNKGVFAQFNAALRNPVAPSSSDSLTNTSLFGTQQPLMSQGVPAVSVPNADKTYNSPGLTLQPIPGL